MAGAQAGSGGLPRLHSPWAARRGGVVRDGGHPWGAGAGSAVRQGAEVGFVCLVNFLHWRVAESALGSLKS